VCSPTSTRRHNRAGSGSAARGVEPGCCRCAAWGLILGWCDLSVDPDLSARTAVEGTPVAVVATGWCGGCASAGPTATRARREHRLRLGALPPHRIHPTRAEDS
jgi:hypothetical protein